MGMSCSVCRHDKIKTINALLIKGDSQRGIAGRYGLKKSAIDRHKQNHLNGKLVKANKKDILTAEGLLEEAKGLFTSMKQLYDQMRAAEDYDMTVKTSRECNRHLELLARLCGQLQEASTINVFINPVFLGVRTKLVRALAGHPEAREAVIKALSDPEGDDDFIENIEDVPVCAPTIDVSK